MQPTSTEKAIALARSFNFNLVQELKPGDSPRFSRGLDHIWECGRPGSTRAWARAELRNDRYQNHQYFAELRDALEAPGNTDESTLAYVLEKSGVDPIGFCFRETAEVLLAWNNTQGPLGNDDLKRLADLFIAGRFEAWRCPSCNDWVMEGDPENWDHFQGVAQIDRVSYPGRGSEDSRCDSCRCYDQ